MKNHGRVALVIKNGNELGGRLIVVNLEQHTCQDRMVRVARVTGC